MKYSVSVDEKWQQKWEEKQVFKYDETRHDKKLYCLEMFSYPSAATLHLGHWYNFGVADVWARFKKMQGYNVFHPMGFDSFGLPSENYAIKIGVHPKDSTEKNIATMITQLKKMGASFDWNYLISTCAEDYYKWTQWIFLKMYEKGLAYQKEAPVNWCPDCQTVLANEQVVDGKCERCKAEVYQKKMKQWFYKITDYAEELLNSIDALDWPEKTKKIQKNWIGKSTGSLITFDIEAPNDKIIQLDAFTTRADTLYGLSYVVIAPEHPLVRELTTPDCMEAVEAYIHNAAKVNEIDRMSTERERTGVFTGSYAINPVDGRKVPLWVADYVIATYGTGFVMAVPAHDERDFDFAQKYQLPISRVVVDKDGNEQPLPFCEKGKLINSAEFSGLSSEDAVLGIVKKLEQSQSGKLTTMYRLRDWLISRQRYWGAPIPIIHCPKCGCVPVPETDLPVKLPYDVEFKPTGESPLARSEEFMNVTCPKCGCAARRDPDTMDTFVDSSWYFLRYADNKNEDKAWDVDKINQMLPVDKYIGGQEHATMHLLYARFFTKVLRDLGYLNFDEPFLSLVHQGMILGADGQKMSKSKGNTVVADDYIQKYGSDVMRLFLSFAFSYVDGGPWSDQGIVSMDKFVRRVEAMIEKFKSIETDSDVYGKEEKELDYVRNYSIQNVAQSVDSFQFNTGLARLMEYLNATTKYMQNETVNKTFLTACMKDYIVMLSPFAPHLSEELWEELGYEPFACTQPWPTLNKDALVKDEVSMGVQVNGKLRGEITVSATASQDEIKETALTAVQKSVEGKEIVKIIVVPKRLVSIVVK